MKITDLLSAESIQLGISLASQEEAIDTMVSLHQKAGNLSDVDAYKAAILKRESEGTTAVGGGIAVPHAKSDAVKTPGLAAVTVPDGVDYQAPDGDAVKLLFMIAAPPDGNLHLEILSRLVTLLMDPGFVNSLVEAKTTEEFMKVIDEAESAKYPEEQKEEPAQEPVKEDDSEKEHFVLAVTACPTGIAHTYMAAEALEKAGKEMGISVKAETNGSGGAKNVLTQEEIKECDGIIVAADKDVPMARFDGKPLVQVKVADGIHKPQELIQKVVAGEAPVYHHKGGAASEDVSADGEGIGRKLYKQLMNGVSHMLPFVVAGGIFIAIAFLIDTIAGNAGTDNFGSVNAVAAWFKTIGGVAFNLMVPILAGYIAYAIADRPGLLVGMVGGFLATSGATFADPGALDTIPSGFLGGMLAGFAGGYMMLLVEKLCEKMPRALEGIKPVLVFPLSGLGIVAIMMCAVNPIMGWLNQLLADGLTYLGDRPGLAILLGCILGGMMAIDMGGPFNKAAYVFGTAALAWTGSAAVAGQKAMAAVMIGGMVPPLAIALSTTIFPKKWNEEERKNGVVNYVMGLSFITEGAIPYAAADPLHVIPSCVIGSAVAGGLSMLFECTLPAPHGGLFVIAVVGNWYLYLLALIIGAAVSCALLTLFKKKK